MDTFDDTTDWAQYHADQQAYQREALRVIDKAQHEPITDDEAALLLWAAGLTH